MLLRIKRFLIDTYKTIKIYKFYSLRVKEKKHDKILVSMIDGRIKHGGLSDRLYGIISAFKYCQEHKINFRINWIYPFSLATFLEPNQYDWRINPDDISYNLLVASPKYVSMVYYDIDKMKKYCDKKFSFQKKQLHLYSNTITFTKEEFQFFFNILFKKSELLNKALCKEMTNIGKEYISITFRFQQLLGDFKEDGFQTLNQNDQRKLINSCLECIEKLYQKYQKRILVTSDSITFLKEAESHFPYVYIIHGSMVHIDYVLKESPENTETYLKSFIDLFMLANAEIIFLANFLPLYASGFAKLASWIYGREYHAINEDLEIVE